MRRAAQNAPNDLLRERAKRDFRYVKRRNPWKTDLTFTFAPNSNINNGSARDTSRLNYAISELLFGEPIEYELNDEAQAIAGIEIGGSVRTRYRFAQTPTTAHDAKLSLSYRTFSITDDLDDDGIKGSDFAFGSLAFGYGYRRLNLDRKGEFALDVEGAKLGTAGRAMPLICALRHSRHGGQARRGNSALAESLSVSGGRRRPIWTQWAFRQASRRAMPLATPVFSASLQQPPSRQTPDQNIPK
ncbi:hypothetical protein [Sulfitobacter sediminilitoris]|uniref:hypothetical protein n=1 Tax=Sulfitobacter sediminilitoris TaxID=2698830 RepID=UPI003612872D